MSLKNSNAIKIPNKLKLFLINKKIQKLFKIFEKNFTVNEPFIVAVSGGPDSLALAFLTKIYSIKNNLKSDYLIVDHKLRKQSTNEAKKVKKILRNINVNADILTWNGKKPLKNIQSLARKKRYELLFSRCKKLGIQNLVIGHHQDDVYENFFIRMTRGSGLKGLISLDKNTRINSINLIRPLLDFEKKNLEFISKQVFNFFVEDSSNKDVIFNRVRIRNIINEFKENGLNKDKLFLTLKNLRSSNNALKFYIELNKEQNSFFHKDNKKLILNNDFFNHPYEIVFRSLSDSLQLVGNKYYSARGKKIDNILMKIQKKTLKKETLAGCVIKKVNQTVIITKEY